MKTDGDNNQPSNKATDDSKYRDTHNQRRNMAYMQEKMKKGALPTIAKMAKEMGVTKRTVQRMKKKLETEQTLTATFDKEKQVFKVSDDVAFSTISVTENEMLAMTVAKKDLAHLQAANLDKSITSAFKKIVSNASARVVKKIKDWDRIISFRTSGETVSDPKIFETLVMSAGYQKKLKIGYRDSAGEVTNRTIDLLHLCNINGDWYFFAFDYLRMKVRTFCPCRIKTIEKSDERFEWPEGWTVNKHLGLSFGVFEGEEGKEYKTVVRFKERVSDFIREKRWKGQTALIELPGGGVELHQTLDSLFELQLWIMKWGKSAKVMSPPRLRDMVYNEAKATTAVYEPRSGQHEKARHKELIRL